MILKHLAWHIRANRARYSLMSWLLCIARSLRVLWFYRSHRAMVRLPLVRDFVAAVHGDDLFHHLSHRHYLARHFGARERVRLLMQHYHFEQHTFGRYYKERIYRGPGLLLWRHSTPSAHFDCLLTVATRHNAEGDLSITLRIDGTRLHLVSFSWVDGAMAGAPGAVLPFVARCQGVREQDATQLERFEQAFPNNAPSWFCLAALQGVALAVGAQQMLGVSAYAQVAARPAKGKQFKAAYDGAWEVLGGAPLPDGRMHLVPVPYAARPLEQLASKHRQRAARRRAHWKAISDSAQAALAALRS